VTGRVVAEECVKCTVDQENEPITLLSKAKKKGGIANGWHFYPSDARRLIILFPFKVYVFSGVICCVISFLYYLQLTIKIILYQLN